MTQTLAVQPGTRPDVTLIRYHRNGTGGSIQRIYVGDDLIGTIERRRVKTSKTGRRMGTRWFVKPCSHAWTRGRIDAPAVPERLTAALPEPFQSEHAARVALADHLLNHGASAVLPLYGVDHG